MIQRILVPSQFWTDLIWHCLDCVWQHLDGRGYSCDLSLKLVLALLCVRTLVAAFSQPLCVVTIADVV